MSYCRFSEGDVYLYQSDRGYECCCCRLAELQPSMFTTGGDTIIFGIVSQCEKCNGVGCKSCMMHGDSFMATAREAIAHIEKHIAAGHDVPDTVIPELTEEVENENAAIQP